MSDQRFAFRRVELSLRPPRVAVAFAESDREWLDICQRIIEWLSKLWGGEYSLILPTDGSRLDERFAFLLERFDPDYIYAYQKTKLDLKLANPSEYERWLDREVDAVLKQYPDSAREQTKKRIDEQAGDIRIGKFELSEVLQQDLLRRFNPFFHERRLQQGWVRAGGRPSFPLTALPEIISRAKDAKPLLIPSFTASKELTLLAASVMGKPSREAVEAYTKTRMIIARADWSAERQVDFIDFVLNRSPRRARQTAVLNGEVINEGNWLLDERLIEYLPFGQTMTGLAYYYKARDRVEHEEAVVVVVGDAQNDFLLYFALSRLKWDVYWLPLRLYGDFMKGLAKPNLDGEGVYFWRLTDTIADILRENPDRRLLVTSFSLTEEQTAEVRANLNKGLIYGQGFDFGPRSAVEMDVEKLLPYVRTVYETENQGRVQVEQFADGLSVNFCNTPKPRQFSEVPPTGHHWITEVLVEGYSLPRRGVLAPEVLQHRNYGTRFVRVCRDGLAYFCPYLGWFQGWGGVDSILARPRIRILSDEEVFERLYREAGFRVRVSDKGKYHHEAVRLFGDLGKMADFIRKPTGRALLDRYLDESPSAPETGVFLTAIRRRFLSFEAIARVLGGAEDAVALLDELIPMGVLSRGLIFQCGRCAHAGWYAVGEFSDVFRCERCRTEQRYTSAHWKKPEEPRWYYELNEVVYQGYLNNMHVPILTILALGREARNGTLYVPELVISRDGRADQEIDTTLAVDGTVMISEATTADHLRGGAGEETAELRRLREVAELVDARWMVLSTFAEAWRDNTLARARAVFEKSRCGLRPLARNDLLA